MCFLFRVKYAILHSCVHHLSEHGKRLVNPLIIIKTKKTFILYIIGICDCVCVCVSMSPSVRVCECIFFLNLTYSIISWILFTFIYRRTKLVVLFVVFFWFNLTFFIFFYCYEMYVCVFFSLNHFNFKLFFFGRQ